MKSVKIFVTAGLAILLVTFVGHSDGKKGTRRPVHEDDDRQTEQEVQISISDRINDSEGSAQGLNPATVNPYATQILLQNQALLQNPSLLGGVGGTQTNPSLAAQTAAALGAGNLQNLGGGVFSNQRFPLTGQTLGGNSFVNAAVGGLSPYQNPLLFGSAGLGSPDIFSQSAAAAQLYNNPYFGAAALGGAGISSGINPLLLRGATNLQYPIIAGNNPYLNAQALLSPYSSYNQLNPYNNFPFASRFGIGVGRSSVGNRQTSNTNNDE